MAGITGRHEVSGWPGQARQEEVAAMEDEVRRLGISAVPISSSENLAQAMREALGKRPKNP